MFHRRVIRLSIFQRQTAITSRIITRLWPKRNRASLGPVLQTFLQATRSPTRGRERSTSCLREGNGSYCSSSPSLRSVRSRHTSFGSTQACLLILLCVYQYLDVCSYSGIFLYTEEITRDLGIKYLSSTWVIVRAPHLIFDSYSHGHLHRLPLHPIPRRNTTR